MRNESKFSETAEDSGVPTGYYASEWQQIY